LFDQEEVEKILKAGRIVKAVREVAPRMVSEGARAIDICDGVEAEIRRLGGQPAFPCNVSIDEVGAHYTSPPGDLTVIPPNSLVKVDIGAHIDGLLADSAVTVSVDSEHDEMIGVAQEALARGVQAVRINGMISDVGVVVEKYIKSMGFKPIRNLTGHQIAPYTIHAGISIPNVSDEMGAFGGRFQQWSIYALEPFVTLPDARGIIQEGRLGNILSLAKLKKPKDAGQRALFERIYGNYRTLPFARRWLEGMPGADLADSMLRGRALYEYPTLVEASRKPIAQAEHTLLTTDKEVLIIT